MRPAISDNVPPPERLVHLFDALDESKVSWSLLRSPETLAAVEGDVDLLVSPPDAERARRIVAAQGFGIVPMPLDLHATDYDAREDRFLWLHLQGEVRLGNARVPADEILARVVRDPLPRPDDSSLFWIVLLHAVLDKGHVADRHRRSLGRLATQQQDAPPTFAHVAERHGLDPAVLVRRVVAGEWDALAADAAEAERRAPTVRAFSPAAWVQDSRQRRGLTVAVIGPDGAGKTTLVNSLGASLPLPTRSLYMGLTGGRLPSADRLRVPGLVLAARLAILWTRYAVGRYHRARGRIVLFDRYVLDGTVPSGVALGRLARVSRRLQARACPTPDIVLLLDASGETMYSRKGAYGAGVLEDWRAAYRRLRHSVAELEVIDAEQPADAVRREALSRIWRCYCRIAS